MVPSFRPSLLPCRRITMLDDLLLFVDSFSAGGGSDIEGNSLTKKKRDKTREQKKKTRASNVSWGEKTLRGSMYWYVFKIPAVYHVRYGQASFTYVCRNRSARVGMDTRHMYVCMYFRTYVNPERGESCRGAATSHHFLLVLLYW